MAKLLRTNGVGSSQTAVETQSEKIKIYSDEADAVADLANIAENEIIATDAGDSQEGVVAVTDEVEARNSLPVTSGGVYDYSAKRIPAFTSATKLSSVNSYSTQVLDAGWYCMRTEDSTVYCYGYIGQLVNGTDIPMNNFSSDANYISGFTIYLEAGTYIVMGIKAALYKLGD